MALLLTGVYACSDDDDNEPMDKVTHIKLDGEENFRDLGE